MLKPAGWSGPRMEQQPAREESSRHPAPGRRRHSAPRRTSGECRRGEKGSATGHVLFDPVDTAFVKWQSHRRGDPCGGCRGEVGVRGAGKAAQRQRETPRGDGMFCILTVATLKSWPRPWSMILGGNWVKGMRDLSVSFLTVACESVMISK